MLTDALGLIARSIGAAITWFGALTNAIPGSANLIVSMFFLISSFSIILRPLYRGGASDLARRHEAQQRQNQGRK